jgi:hypothetical protein
MFRSAALLEAERQGALELLKRNSYSTKKFIQGQITFAPRKLFTLFTLVTSPLSFLPPRTSLTTVPLLMQQAEVEQSAAEHFACPADEQARSEAIDFWLHQGCHKCFAFPGECMDDVHVNVPDDCSVYNKLFAHALTKCSKSEGKCMIVVRDTRSAVKSKTPCNK